MQDPSTDVVEIWLVPLDDTSAVPLARTVLSRSEVRRADRFRFAADRRRYVLAHAALRAILGLKLGKHPQLLRFVLGPHGKPALEPPEVVRFNLTHADERALVAIAWGRQIGVDLERIREDRANEDIARHFFSADEVSRFLALPSSERTAAFFRCWTRKESFIKATGEGFAADLGSFDVSLEAKARRLLLATRPDADERYRWTMLDVPVWDGYAAAVTVEGCGVRLDRRPAVDVRRLLADGVSSGSRRR